LSINPLVHYPTPNDLLVKFFYFLKGSKASVHNKFLELLTQKYKQLKHFELRNKIWNILLFSSFYDKTKALKLFKEEKDKNEFFVEKLFIKANVREF